MAHQTFVDYYKVLNITPSATATQIRTAYIASAKKQHPDKGGNVHTMRQLNQAYTALKTATLKKEYDKQYRKHILGEKVTDMSFNEDEDWDLDEVDEFLRAVYQQDKRRAWTTPLTMAFVMVGAGLILFVIVAVTRMTSSGDNYQPSLSSKKADH